MDLFFFLTVKKLSLLSVLLCHVYTDSLFHLGFIVLLQLYVFDLSDNIWLWVVAVLPLVCQSHVYWCTVHNAC
jgi:hypothetical protein